MFGLEATNKKWKAALFAAKRGNNFLLNGYDDIGLTLTHADEIRAFEAKRLAAQPWLA